jgi:molybdopterin/thiamine biosynthesis adenylyltransferase
MLDIKVIGIGGIGCALLPHLVRYLAASADAARLTLVDGDAFETRNADRQAFPELGNRPGEVTMEPTGAVRRAVVPGDRGTITPENVGRVIRSGDVGRSPGVDNHSTRRLVTIIPGPCG